VFNYGGVFGGVSNDGGVFGGVSNDGGVFGGVSGGAFGGVFWSRVYNNVGGFESRNTFRKRQMQVQVCPAIKSHVWAAAVMRPSRLWMLQRQPLQQEEGRSGLLHLQLSDLQWQPRM
jgi:hypothetical protein